MAKGKKPKGAGRMLALEKYRGKRSGFRWRIWSPNGRKMANGGEGMNGYTTKGNMERALEVVFGSRLKTFHVIDNT